MEERRASFAMTVFNLAHSTFGAGILGLSYAAAQLGIGLFMIFNALTAAVAIYTSHLLLELREKADVEFYEEIGFAAFKRPGRIITALSVVLENIGSMATYLFIVKYEFPNLIKGFTGANYSDGSWYYNGDIFVILITCCVAIPLACFKKMSFLSYTSGLSLFCMVFFTLAVAVEKFLIPCPLELGTELAENATSAIMESSGATDSPVTTNAQHPFAVGLQEEYGHQQCKAEAFRPTLRWIYGLPILVFAYSGHSAILPLYSELKKPTRTRMESATCISFGICFTVFSVAAIFGYLTFYNWTGEELLLTYSYAEPTDKLIVVVRLFVVVSVTLGIPLVHFTTRKAISFLLFPNKGFSWIRHLGIMLVTMVFLNLIVIFVPGIRDVFAITGATGCNLLVIILPCVFFLRLDESPRYSPRKIAIFCLCCLGFILLVGSVALIIHGYTI